MSSNIYMPFLMLPTFLAKKKIAITYAITLILNVVNCHAIAGSTVHNTQNSLIKYKYSLQ